MAISPPCATLSRATWATRRGPRPVRSLAEPRGLAKLTTKERDRAILGNIFADFACEVARVALNAAKFFVMEQPEDLGAMPLGYDPFVCTNPASASAITNRPGYCSRLALACRALSSKGYPCSTTRATTRDRCGNWLPPQRRPHGTWWLPRLPTSGQQKCPSG